MSSEEIPSTSAVASGTVENSAVHIATAEGGDHGNGEEIINWMEEAKSIINDVKTHVAEIDISKILPNNESHIYLNIRTFEGATYCVHVSSSGFRIVSEIYDTIDEVKDESEESVEGEEKELEFFETPYALLDKISPRYVESFGNQLCRQLLQLQQMRTEFNEEDEDAFDLEEEEDAFDLKTEE